MRIGLLALIVLALPGRANAQAPACDEEAARADRVEATRLMTAGDYAGAIPAIERAMRLCPDPRLLFWRCRCLEEDCSAAARCYERYFAGCEGRECPDREGARGRHEKLMAEQCGRVRVTSSPPGAALSVDGAPRGAAPRELLLPRGLHGFEGSLRGHEPASAQAEIRGGANPDVVLTLPEIAEDVPPPPPCVERGKCLGGWITLGGGLAVAATGALFTVQAYGAAGDFDAAGTRRAQDDASAAIDDHTTTAAVLYGVGGAAVVTGVALLVWDAARPGGGGSAGAGLTPAPGGFAFAF